MTLILKNVDINNLYQIVRKYKNTYHGTIKIEPVNVKSSTYIDFNKEIVKVILNLKFVKMLKYQNIKIFLQKSMFQICLVSGQGFVIKKV